MVAAYLKAADTGTIITSAPLVSDEVSAAAGIEESQAVKLRIERCKLMKSNILYQLGKAKKCSPDNIWLLRRHGYTEKENPHHQVYVLLERDQDEEEAMTLYTFQAAALEPTIEEYIDALYETFKICGNAMVTSIYIDVESRLDELEAVLSSIHVEVEWFAPLSPEEKYFASTSESGMDDLISRMDSGLCVTCSVAEKDDGTPLARCTGCNVARYCCKEHQKIDWPKHKALCKHVKMLNGHV